MSFEPLNQEEFSRYEKSMYCTKETKNGNKIMDKERSANSKEPRTNIEN